MPGDTKQQNVRIDPIPQKRVRGVVAVNRAHIGRPDDILDRIKTLGRVQISVAVAREFPCWHLGAVQHRFRHAGLDGLGRFGHRADDKIAANQGICGAFFDPHLLDKLRARANPQVGNHRPKFLREPHEIEDGDALVFQMCRHCDQLADSDNAGAAHTGHQNIKWHLKVGHLRRAQLRLQRVKFCRNIRGRAFLAGAAFDGHKAGAEAIYAGKILVARVQIDLTLAPKGRFFRLYAQTVGFNRTVATALTDKIVDHSEFLGVVQLAAFAQAALFGGAGLLINQDRDPGDLAQVTLHAIKLTPVIYGDALREISPSESLRVIRDHRDTIHTFRAQLFRNGVNRYRAVNILPAGHGHGVIEQNFIGDVCFGCDSLTDRHKPGMVICAIP